MADDAKENEEVDTEGGEDEEGEGKKKGGLKKLILFIGLPVIILALGGAAAFMLLSGGGDDELVVAEGEHGEGGDGHGAGADDYALDNLMFYRIPADEDHVGTTIQVTISDGVGGFAQLAIAFNLEITDPHVEEELNAELPRVIDQFMGFLRELRPEDIAGSAGGERIRMELHRRVNLVIGEGKVHAVLIEQFLIA